MIVLRGSGELESDEPIEQSSFEWLNCSYSSLPTTYSPPWGPTNFPYFPPSPTYSPLWGPTSFPPSPPSFPLYLPASPLPPPSSSTCSSYFLIRTKANLSQDFQNQQHEDVDDLTVVDLKLFAYYLIEDRGGELNVINGLEVGALNVIYVLEGGALNVINRLEEVFEELEEVFEDVSFEINELEQQHEDIVDQLVIDYARVDHCVIGYEGQDQALSTISGGGVCTINGVEFSQGQALSTTPEPSFVFQDKLFIRVWLGHRGQWVADIHYGWNWVNIGTFRTAEGAPLAFESVKRWRGGRDLFDYPPFLIENGSEPLHLPPTPQEENQDGGIGCEGIGDCAMADQAQFNSKCLEKSKTREKNPGGERRNKKANGVRIAISLDDILQTKGMCLKDAANYLKVSISKLKSSCREYGIPRWPPRNEHKLIRQSLPKETPAVVDQMGIPQLTSHTVPSNQVLTATIDTNSVVEKEILPPQFLPTAQQGNFDAGFDNDEVEAIGVGVEETWEAGMEEAQLNSGGFGNDEAETIGVGIEGTREAVMEEAQLNSGCSGKKGKRKVNTPGGVRDNNRTGVRIAIPKEDILQTKGMRLIDAAKHLEVSKSTLKRVCREYDIYRWPPRKEQELIGQSHPNKSPAVVNQEQIPQLNPDTLLSSNQVPATSDTYSVKVKVRCEEGTIMFRLSCPWRKVELEQQVKERLLFEAGTYKIEYKDEDDELILINCDKDLEECISSSSVGGSRSIELFLKLK